MCSMLVLVTRQREREGGHSVELADLVVQNPHDVSALLDEDGAESELGEHVGVTLAGLTAPRMGEASVVQPCDNWHSELT